MTKIPRFAFEKFKGARGDPVDRDEVGRRGDGDRPQLRREPAEGAARAGDRAVRPRPRDASSKARDPAEIESALARPTPDRLLVAARGACARASRSSEINADRRLRSVVPRAARGDRRRRGGGARSTACRATPRGMRRLKAMGFSDARLGQLSLRSAQRRARDEPRAVAAADRASSTMRIKAMTGGVTEAEVRAHRLRLGVRPGVQAHRQLRGRVRCDDALSVLDLRGAAVRRARGRGRRHRPEQGR